MSVIQLTSQDFEIVGEGLHIKRNGFVFVMFKMPSCVGCKAVTPVFIQLSSEESAVDITYATADISVHKDIVRMSRLTSTPIQTVPTLILYFRGRPVAKVKDKKDITSLRNFLAMATPAVLKKAQSAPPPVVYQPQQTHRPSKSQPQPTGKVYYPEGYRDIGAIQCEGDQCVLIPERIHPHNKPWETILD